MVRLAVLLLVAIGGCLACGCVSVEEVVANAVWVQLLALLQSYIGG